MLCFPRTFGAAVKKSKSPPPQSSPAGLIPGRPDLPGYGIPKDTKGLLPWSFVDQRMTRSQAYWLCTSGSGARPHSVPVWGVWVDGAVFWGGGADVRWARNLAANAELTVHAESGDEVVILEGRAELIRDPEHPLLSRVSDAYHAKYKMRHPPPFWSLRPQRVFAWTTASRFQDATRWKSKRAE